VFSQTSSWTLLVLTTCRTCVQCSMLPQYQMDTISWPVQLPGLQDKILDKNQVGQLSGDRFQWQDGWRKHKWYLFYMRLCTVFLRPSGNVGTVGWDLQHVKIALKF
jgi:hypothetical protein